MSVWSAVPIAPPNKIFNLNTLYDTTQTPGNSTWVSVRTGLPKGRSYVFEVVRQAETALYEGLKKNELNKEYLPIRGDDKFVRFAKELLYGVGQRGLERRPYWFGTVHLRHRCTAVGGRVLIQVGGKPTVYLSNPTWGNHATIFKGAGLSVQTYDYYDPSTLGVNYNNLTASLQSAALEA